MPAETVKRDLSTLIMAALAAADERGDTLIGALLSDCMAILEQRAHN